MSGSDAVKANAATTKQPIKGSNPGKATDGARKQTASPVDGQSRKQSTPQPRAWQGPNPITQRTAATPNGAERAVLKPQPQPQQKDLTQASADKHAHDRALYLVASFVGHDATLTMKNGEQFTGVFSGGSFGASTQQYILTMVKRTRLPTSQQVNGNIDLPNDYIGDGEDHVMAFDKEDTAELHVPDVVPFTAQPVQNGSITSSFRTDTEISARDSSSQRERPLERWNAGPESSIGMALEDSGEAGWDQFAANERMYGVQSTYDENYYTTQINRSDPRFTQLEAKATRIAQEIEGTAPANSHVAEERQRDADRGEGLDEEEKYSGVQRDTTAFPRRTAGAYVPPSQRPITNVPTVPGAPFDPAIISLAKPSPAASTERSLDPMPAVETATGPKTPEINQAADEPKVTASATQLKKSNVTNAEDHVRNVTDHFKQFANTEKLRIRQAQEMKRSTARTEKNIKLNDLKRFAQHFELHTRVPDDLVPILAKDSQKQGEIKRKAEESALKAEQQIQEREKQKSAEASPALSNTTSNAGTTVPHTQPGLAKQRMSGSIRPAPHSGPLQPPRHPGGPTQNRAYGRPMFPPQPHPFPADLRIPTGPAIPAAESGPLSPGTKFNPGAKAFEFRPAASTFTPTIGASQSRERSKAKPDTAPSTEAADFFKDSAPVEPKDRKEMPGAFNPLKRMLATEQPEEQKKQFASNGGIPQPYRTPPTWPVEQANIHISYKDSMPKPPQESHPMHMPGGGNGQIPHVHQLPPHMVGPPPGRPQFMPSHHAPSGHYMPGAPHLGPNGSVQNSPRFHHQQMAFSGQMPNMPQFAQGQMPGYGMSPNMAYRQMHMPPQGPMMMMPGQAQGQMHMPPNYPRGQPGFNQQMMSGMPGMPNGPPNGNFMPGPMPGSQPHYSPMPPHATPHMNPGQPYGSPRPGHMMQHTQSHQGYQPGGGMHMGMAPPPPFGQSPGAPHSYHMQQRQMSQGAYPQMTPRQAHSHPAGAQPSPGQGMGAPGDEGK